MDQAARSDELRRIFCLGRPRPPAKPKKRCLPRADSIVLCSGPRARRRTPGKGDPSMEPRIKSPAMTLPGAMDAMVALGKAVEAGGVPRATLELCNLRAS